MEAVISMPPGVFKPYSGVGTAVLVFTKGNKTDSVWFYEMESDGYSLNDNRDFIDGKGDVPDIIDKFKTKKPSKKSFIIPFEKIKKNDYILLISQYKEIEYEEIKYEKPEKIINRTLKMEDKISDTMKELKGLIKNAKSS